MAMNKKEQQEMERLKKELCIAKALRFTDEVAEDVFPPKGYNELSTGFVFNEYSRTANVACCSSVYHAVGRTDKTTTQDTINMFSTKVMALKALRHALEIRFASELAEIDKKIEHAESAE